MIYSLVFLVCFLFNGALGQQHFVGSFIPSFSSLNFATLSQMIPNPQQFATMQMPSMPQFGSINPASPSSTPFSMPNRPGQGFPSQSNGPSFPSFPSAGGNQASPPSISQNNQPPQMPFANQNNPTPPSLSSLPTPDPQVMQNALSSIGSSLNNLQQNLAPNRPNPNPNSNTSPNPSTSSLPPYPYSSDSAKIDAALRQLMPGFASMTPAQLQSTISSLSDSDMQTFQKQIGIDNSKFSKLSVFEAPFAPSTSCHQLDFGCQSYSSCFSCYKNRAHPKCGACLQLRSCSDDNLSCLLDGICKLCSSANDNAPMCGALQKRCATVNVNAPPHP